MDLDLLNEFWKRTEQEPAFKSYNADLRKARPFSLDDELDDVVGELAFREPTSDKVMRRFLHAARLPFPVMWIEHGQEGFERGVKGSIQGRASRTGWLLRELDNDKGGYIAQRVSSVLNDHDKVVRASSYPLMHYIQPGGGIDYMQFGSIERAWAKGWQTNAIDAMREINRLPSLVMMGWNANAVQGADVDETIASLQHNPLYGTAALMLDPRFAYAVIEQAQGNPTAAVAQYVHKVAQDQIGELRYLIAALSLLNEVPVRFVPYKPSGHIRAGGRLKPYMASSVVTLEVPATRRRIREIRDHLKAAGDTHSKRRHEVRGHWRHCDKLPETNPERWERFEDRDGRLRFRTWIPNHARGDASLGWVRQSYDVVHGRGPIPGVKGVEHGIA